MKKSALVWFVILLAGAMGAEQPATTKDFQTILSSVRVPELPQVAAVLVSQAAVPVRIETAKQVVRAAVRIRPAATVAVVGAIARSEPETAAAVAETAAVEQPGLVVKITRACACVAPGYAGEVVAAVCRAAPDEYHNVALAAAQVSPAMGREILRGASEARGGLRPYIELELAKYRRAVPLVSRCLENAERAAARSAGPGGGRHRPKDGPPGQDDNKPPRGNQDHPGGRNYARP